MGDSLGHAGFVVEADPLDLPPEPRSCSLLAWEVHLSGSIFVSIAAYRDPDCVNTLRSLFATAHEPDRIRVGLCWQALPGIDDEFYPVRDREDQCALLFVDARESRGACWARSRIESLWRGEDYFFQIDSHMRFTPDWDVALQDMLAKCASDKPVLSTYAQEFPKDFSETEDLAAEIFPNLYAQKFDDDGVLLLGSTCYPLSSAPELPERNPFFSANFFFAAASVIEEVPYDPHLYFFGEEISMAVRLFTHGWDVFTPNAVPIYHNYERRPERGLHWDDHGDWRDLDRRSKARVRHLLRMEDSRDPDVLVDIDDYSLGAVRSLADYEKFAGVDFRTRTIYRA